MMRSGAPPSNGDHATICLETPLRKTHFFAKYNYGMKKGVCKLLVYIFNRFLFILTRVAWMIFNPMGMAGASYFPS